MSTCINNGNIYILFDEQGISITNTKPQLALYLPNIELFDYCFNGNRKNKSKALSFYNDFISKELIGKLQHILSSSVLTQNILQHPKKEIQLNNQVLDTLKRFVELINFISTIHKDKNSFLDKWKDISDFIAILTNFKDIRHTCVDLRPRTEETNIQENQLEGKIVFIYSDATFSFKNHGKFIGMGITCKSCSNLHSRTSIQIFGSSLVQVSYPTNDYVDERGMFVILNEKQEDNIGIGEIISFRDLIARDANSYHLVGICSLDKTEQLTNSLFLFRTSSTTSRIRDHSNHPDSCFVLMMSLPMSNSLGQKFLQSTPWNITERKLSSLLL